MDAAEILVTGGTGLLGSRVVEHLDARGARTRILSHSGRAGTIRGDLLTGEGLEQAVAGAGTVVHCASSPTKTHQVDVEGTHRLLQAAGRAGVSHIVFISIVGVDLNPYFRYYRTKLEVERMVERSPLPWTILRATQFHDFVLRLIRVLERLPVLLAPKDVFLQPIDVSEVAGRLTELALSDPLGHVPVVGGPEVRTLAELTRSYLEAAGRRRRVLEVPLPGKTARALREGAQLALDHRYGKLRWEEFLEQTIRTTGA
jgi:uncharacterized protein YbjT (DUF2867 family)